eukprot:TRINITY_DN46819_c0_g1_i1.p1 TRINITY_DN46819_c0_g1~~TRINITY_DN46819_c0_g1_i1.p1  ORF type:complete len:629 (+),score=50.79 TRINITY_DN46819_c0_g1_i1:112-1998(+)
MGVGSSAQADGNFVASDDPHGWYQGNQFCNVEQLCDVLIRTIALDQHEASAWEGADREALLEQSRSGEPLSSDAKTWLWRGVPDHWKELVWAAACGARSVGVGGAAKLYDRRLLAAFGEHVPSRFERCPTFGEESHTHSVKQNFTQCVPFYDLLNEEGWHAAARILWCISQEWGSQIEFCPVLPVLVCLLLVFCSSEGAAYAIVESVLAHAEQDLLKRESTDSWGQHFGDLIPFPYLPLSREEWGGVAKRAVALIAQHMPAEVDHLRALDMDLEEIVLLSLQDGLAWRLPFRAVCRMYGVFLAKGSEVFVQHLVALWLHMRRELGEAPSREVATTLLLRGPAASGVIEEPRTPHAHSERADGLRSADTKCRAIMGVTDLSRRACRIRVPSALGQIKSEVLGTRKMPCEMPFCRPRLNDADASQIIWDGLWAYLWQWLPPLCRTHDPCLIFSPHRHGYSLCGLLERCSSIASGSPMFLILSVRDRISLHRGVIGAFLPIPLHCTGPHRYLDIVNIIDAGTFVSDAYVFRVLGDRDSHERPQAWFWTARNEMLFSASADSDSGFVCVGGNSPALSLDGDLRAGSTSSCQTFLSPALLSPSDTIRPASCDTASFAERVDYDVLDVEVFELH